MLQSIKSFLATATVAMAVVAVAAPGFAETQKDAYHLEPVTVSAQKREEDIQDVPMSVNVLNDLTLEESRITDMVSLNKVVPNLHISTSGGSGVFTFMGIRGRMNNGVDVDPTVTILVDGVPYDDTFSMGNNLLFDIERIEVLRGPQSTMYGMNSIAGVVNIITKKPGDELRVKAFGEGGIGDKWDGTYLAGGSMSGPLVEDVLRGGLAVMVKGQGGYIKNLATGNRYNNDDNIATKGDINWTPTENWDISTGLSYTRNSGNFGYANLPIDKAAAQALGQSFEEWGNGIDHEGDTEAENWGTHLKINYLFDALEFTSMTAYRTSEQSTETDMDLTPTPMLVAHIDSESWGLTQELRLQSRADEDSPLEWMGGYFYYTFNRDLMMGRRPSASTTITAFTDGEVSGDNHAVFGQATYRFLDRKLGLTLGLRQEWTEREAEDHLGRWATTKETDSMFLPKVALDYRLTPDHLLYASVTRGWRSGGANHRAAAADQILFKKETCWAYEVGAKTKWLDNRVRFNAAAFYTDYRDYQDLVSVGLVFYLNNVPKVKMAGFETELEAHVTPDLLLTGGLGYTNAWYVDFPDAVAGDFNGNKVMLTPDFNANLALRYTFLDNFYVRPEVQGVGTIYFDRDNDRKEEPYATYNLRLGYIKDNYEFYLFGENLTNEYAFAYAANFRRNGELYGTPNTPRRVGLGASFTF